MSRRHAAEKKVIPADPIYGSVTLERFINKVMMHGKKASLEKLFITLWKDLLRK